MAGRRYGLSHWQDMGWGTSSSAINTPVQGSAADQKELAIAVLSAKYPDYSDNFLWDLHDGLFSNMSKTASIQDIQAMNQTLDAINYEEYWGVKLPVPFTWEGSFGPTWGSKTVVGPLDDGSLTLENFYEKSLL